MLPAFYGTNKYSKFIAFFLGTIFSINLAYIHLTLIFAGQDPIKLLQIALRQDIAVYCYNFFVMSPHQHVTFGYKHVALFASIAAFASV